MSSIAPRLALSAALFAALAIPQDPPGGAQEPVPGNPNARGDEAWSKLGEHLEEIATKANDPAKLAADAAGAELRASLLAALEKSGVRVDPAAGELRLRGRFGSPRMPLEFLLVHERGAGHESLFVTDVRPSAITTAVHLLGLKPGKNVTWTECDPFPTEAEVRAGARTHDIVPPSGDGLFVYVEWTEEGRVRRYRVEDLVVTENDGRAMPYTPWIFLGSRFQNLEGNGPEYFAADVEGDIVSLCYFSAGTQVFTNPHPLALRPIFWPNHTLVPERGTPVEIVFALREREARAR